MKNSGVKQKSRVRRPKAVSAPPLTVEEKIAEVLHYVDTMSRAESRRSLIRAGIITPDGKLAPPYR